MNKTSDDFIKNLSKTLLIAHLVIAFLINILSGNYQGLLGFLGVIAYTAGNQILVFTSFFLLLYKKISKIGTCVFISLQIIGSIGIYCALFIDTIPVLGVILGISCNILYVASMVSLLYYNLKSKDSLKLQTNTSFSSTIHTTTNPTIKFCRKCGNKLVPESKFCNKCGSSTNWKE